MSHTKRPPKSLAGYARLSAVATLLLAPAALAQPAGLPAFELERLELNPNGRGSLLTGTGELLPKGGFRLSLAGQYENDPLVMYRDGNRLGSVVADRVTAHLLAAWAPMQWLELGVQLPLVAWQRGDDLSAQGIAAPASTGLSTPTAHVTLGLLAQRREAPVDLALELGVGLPVGSVDTLSRDSMVRLAPKVMVGRSFGLLRAGVEARALIRPAVVLGDTGEAQNELGNEVRLGAVLATTGSGLRGELNVRGTVPLTQQPGSLEVLAGLRLPLGDSLEAYALGGPGFGDAPGTPSFRVLLGMAVGGGERVDASRRADAGVKNGVDAYPTEAGPVERQGYPAKDTDGDTVADHLDNCPTEKGVATNAGCPEQQKQLVAIQKGKLEIKESVFFATGEAVIQTRSFEMLDQVAKILQQHPEVDKMVIEGHTDDLGNAEANRKLSLARAEAVKGYLVSKGVEPSRLEAKGFGPDRPIDSSKTEKGRAANRRVEFIIVPPERELRS